MRRFGLHDDEWNRIRDLLPGRLGHVGVTAGDNRLFVEAVLYRYRTVMPWRDLLKRFGDWKAVRTCIARWAKAGVWERVFKSLARDADNEYAMTVNFSDVPVIFARSPVKLAQNHASMLCMDLFVLLRGLIPHTAK